MKSQPELLAPAGDFECLVAAINAGADAIYFGLQELNMRARAKNFKIKDLPKITKLCKPKNIKKYLTLNTIIYNNELKNAEKIIKRTKPYVNAIICSDISIMLLCKKHNIPFHISTQCSVSNSKTAEFYKKLGAKRIVLARELNLKQIKKISKIIPVEIFIHGAMCLAVSGRCLTSQFLFNESANRGKCIHPCRRHYTVKDKEGNELRVKNNYIFSAKDLCALPFIKELKKSNISAFKIEGRNKEPEYVDTVVRAYRKAIDNDLSDGEIKKGVEELKKVYNKGFSSGFLVGIPGSEDFSKSEHSSAKQSKQFIGKITHYYPKIKVGLLHLNAGSLKIGDDILIIGNTTGVAKCNVKTMEVKKKNVEKVKKGDDVGVRLPKCRKGDEVYRIVKK